MTRTISRRGVILGTAAFTASAALAGCQPRMSGILTGADAHPADYPTVRAVEYIGRLLSEWTGGRLGIKVFAGGQLGSEMDTLEIASFGGIDLSRVYLAPLNSIEPMTLPFSLPFLFDSTAHLRRAVDSSAGDAVLASLERHRLIGLCFYDSGARSFYNIRRPIVRPEDMAGLKLRVPPSDLAVAMIRALGGDAVPVPFGETYQALAQGVIDGGENNLPAYVSARHYEVARYLSISNHLFTPEMLVMSKASYNSMTKSDRDLVRAAAKESVGYMRTLWDARVAEVEREIARSQVAVNQVERALFVDLMRPVWNEFITAPGQRAIVDRILEMRQS